MNKEVGSLFVRSGLAFNNPRSSHRPRAEETIHRVDQTFVQRSIRAITSIQYLQHILSFYNKNQILDFFYLLSKALLGVAVSVFIDLYQI